MQDYCFFFSYSSADRTTPDPDSLVTDKTDYLRIFFEDVQQEIRRRYRDGGFFDKKDLRSSWREELIQGLAASRILVPVYSKSYFASRHCAKEWEVFRRRARENPESSLDVTKNVFLPVLWEWPLPIPDEVDEIQYFTNDDYPPEYKNNGLYKLMRLDRYKEPYTRFLLQFTSQLLEIADQQGVPKIRDVPDFDDLYPPFPKKRCRGLKQIYYIFLAGLKPEMARRKVDCYGGRHDRTDWRPCFPDVSKPARLIAESASTSDRVIEILAPPTDEKSRSDLLDDLREAQRRNNMIVLMVDPWSLDLPDFQPLVDALQKEGFPNAGVLVNWNLKDPETQAKPEVLEAAKIRFAKYYPKPVSSESDVAEGVRGALDAVRARLTELGMLAPADPDTNEAHPLVGTRS